MSEGEAAPGIFITYRRVDSRVYAGRLFDRLSHHFGRERVFMDVEGGIARGDDFSNAIEKAINSAAAVVVVIGRQWLTCTDLQGMPRLEYPGDWVRGEIRVALTRRVLLLPVLVDGASMPSPQELPEDLRSLTLRQASEISDIRWDYDVGEIVKTLERVVKPVPLEFIKDQSPASRSFLFREWSKWPTVGVVVLAILLAAAIGRNEFVRSRPNAIKADSGSRTTEATPLGESPPTTLSSAGPPERLVAESPIESIAFSPNGHHLAYSSGGHIMVWNMPGGRPVLTLQGDASDPPRVLSLAFSPDSQILAAGGCENDIKLFSTDNWQLTKTLSGHRDWVRSVAFSQDGRYIGSGADDNTVKVWELPSGRLLKTFTGHSGFVLSVSFSADGKRIASAGFDGVIKVWNTFAEPALSRTITVGSKSVEAVAFSPDGQLFAWPSEGGAINLWDAQTLQPIRTLRRPPTGTPVTQAWAASALVFSRDSRKLVSAFVKTVALWDVTGGQLIDADLRHESFVNAVAISQDDTWVASGGQDKTLLSWRLR